MAGSLLPEPKQQFLNDIGSPLFGGKILTYAAGTLTPKATYQDQALTIANTNPVIANARGEVVMYGSGSYRLILQDAFGTTIYDRDNIDSADVAIGSLAASLLSALGAGLIGYSISNTYASSTVGYALQQFVSITQFLTQAEIDDAVSAGRGIGVPTIDTTAKIQAALDYCDTNNKVLYGGNLRLKISGPLFCRGPGIEFDRVGYFPGLLLTGSDYTALTVTGRPTHMDITMAGSRNVVNGILYDNIVCARTGVVRILDIAGFGLKYDTVFDSLIGPESVENCGSLTENAYWVGSTVGSTTNMCVFSRTQVESSQYKSMYVDPNTLCCTWLNIHSEKAVGQAGVNTWQLGGNNCTYINTRLDASGGISGNASVKFVGAACNFIGPRVEGDISTGIEGFTGNPMHFINPVFTGTTFLTPGQSGIVTIDGGSILRLNTQPNSLRVWGTKISTLTIGPASFNPNLAIFTGCTISALVDGDASSAATFEDCRIDGGGFLSGRTVLNNSQVTMSDGYTISSRAVEMNNSTITTPNLNVDSAGLFMRNGSYIFGSVTFTGNFNSMADSTSYVTGTVTGWGPPVYTTFLPGGLFRRGMRQHNLVPAVGQPKGWLYTGTYPFTSEGNL